MSLSAATDLHGTIQPFPVRLENISKRFGSAAAVDNVSLDIPRGAFTTLLGPSGCGKTTLLRTIAGFYEPDAGFIYIGDQQVNAVPTHRRGTAMVFQDYALWPHMTVYDNIAYGLRMNKVGAEEIERRVRETLALVELNPEYLKRRPSELSGGQQQRVALARALIVQPRVLLLDEPLSNLDAQVRQRLRLEIRRLQRRIGITTLYVTHDQEEALSMSDVVVVMNLGRVMQVGKPEEIYRKPASAFVAEFMGVSNVLRGKVAADGRSVAVAGACIPYAGTPGAPVTVVFKADDAQLISADMPGTVIFNGSVEETFFYGVLYRHFISVADAIILYDRPTPLTAKQVRLAVANEKIQVFADA